MKTYLVGGAVRDELLGRPVTERDWVVVGATPAELVDRGFRQVGKDFPVFIHPETGEEYALARVERKIGPGYHGFQFDASANVTLEEDLRRRDLTINAMAVDENGQLLDPCGGARDLEAKCLRHVSDAFAEDPVRVLRIARFAARFADLGFTVAPDTQRLMERMVASGEVDALVPERVWAETARALGEASPQVFVRVLRECGALGRVFPEVDRLFGVPQLQQDHTEVDTGLHLLRVLEQASRLGASIRARFAAMVHDLGKGLTPKNEWPRHRGHEDRGAKLVRQLCERLRVPNDFRDLALLVTRHHNHCHHALEMAPRTLLEIFTAARAFRKPNLLEDFLVACEADARGRNGREDRAYPQADVYRAALAAAAPIRAAPFVAEGLAGAEIGKALDAARLRAVERCVKEFSRKATGDARIE